MNNNQDFSLYRVFGKFMGSIKSDTSTSIAMRIKSGKNLTKEITERAEDHGLKARFVSGPRPDDIGRSPETKDRLNVIAQADKFGEHRIVEISIG